MLVPWDGLEKSSVPRNPKVNACSCLPCQAGILHQRWELMHEAVTSGIGCCIWSGTLLFYKPSIHRDPSAGSQAKEAWSTLQHRGLWWGSTLTYASGSTCETCLRPVLPPYFYAVIDRKAVYCYRKVGRELGRHAVKGIRFDLNLVQWSEDSSSCTRGTHSKRLKPFCLI